VSGVIKTDGSLEEWGDYKKFQIRLNDPAQLVVGVPHTAQTHDGRLKADWSGESDLSAFADLKYDSENLYVAVKVIDDVICNTRAEKTPFLAYEGDCVELFIDARDPSKQGKPGFDGDVWQIFLVPPKDSGSAPVVEISQPKGGALSGMVVNFTRNSDGYSMETKIPLANFPRLSMKNNSVIGFNIAVDDNDDPSRSGRKSQMVWSPSKAASSDPSVFGKLIVK
jgi:hypothetical protein